MDNDIQVATSPKEVASLLNPTSVPPTANEFEKTLAEIEEDKKKREEQTKELLAAQEKAKPQPKPLQLTYKWIGNCECGEEPKTIMVDTEGGYYATAFCLKEEKQLKSFKVDKLPIPEPITPVEPPKTAPIEESGIMIPKKGKNN